MGLEHLGIVVGEEADAFSRERRAALTGQQFQNADTEPYYVLFEGTAASWRTEPAPLTCGCLAGDCDGRVRRRDRLGGGRRCVAASDSLVSRPAALP